MLFNYVDKLFPLRLIVSMYREIFIFRYDQKKMFLSKSEIRFFRKKSDFQKNKFDFRFLSRTAIFLALQNGFTF